MQTVTIKRDVLLGRLRNNREAHADAVTEARAEYLKAREKELKEWAQMLLKDKVDPPRRSALAEVPDYTDEYDEAIEMLQMETRDELEISRQDFRQYVRDEWGWKHDFQQSMGVNSAYLSR